MRVTTYAMNREQCPSDKKPCDRREQPCKTEILLINGTNHTIEQCPRLKVKQ